MGNMKTSPLAHRLQRQQGATLIVMVLLTMLMLLAVLLVTTNLTMGASRTTSDQTQTIPAQFAAETGIASAKAQLRAFRGGVPMATANQVTYTYKDPATGQTAVKTEAPTDTNLQVGDAQTDLAKRGVNLNYSEVMQGLRDICGDNPINDVSGANPTIGTRTYRGTTVSNVQTVCEFPTDTAKLSGNQLNLFRSLLITANPGTALSNYYDAQGLTTNNDRESFLEAVFGNPVSQTVQPLSLIHI